MKIESKYRLWILGLVAIVYLSTSEPVLLPIVYYTLFAFLILFESLRLIQKIRNQDKTQFANYVGLGSLGIIILILALPKSDAPAYPFPGWVFLVAGLLQVYLVFAVSSILVMCYRKFRHNKAEPVDTDNPVNPPGNSKNQLDD